MAPGYGETRDADVVKLSFFCCERQEFSPGQTIHAREVGGRLSVPVERRTRGRRGELNQALVGSLQNPAKDSIISSLQGRCKLKQASKEPKKRKRWQSNDKHWRDLVVVGGGTSKGGACQRCQ